MAHCVDVEELIHSLYPGSSNDQNVQADNYQIIPAILLQESYNSIHWLYELNLIVYKASSKNVIIDFTHL